MTELVNYASVTGLYNNMQTVINSNETTTLLVNNLEITKIANKKAWATDNLIYTINIHNPTSTNYTNITITDVLNPNLISLVVESVRINDVPAAFGNFTYNHINGNLIIFLPIIERNEDIVIKFHVKKRNSEIFILNNYATLNYSNNTVTSNIVVVNALSSICKCKANLINIEWKNENQ